MLMGKLPGGELDPPIREMPGAVWGVTLLRVTLVAQCGLVGKALSDVSEPS